MDSSRFHHSLFFVAFTFVLLQQWSGHTICPAMLRLPHYTIVFMLVSSVFLFIETLTKYKSQHILIIGAVCALVLYGVYELPGYFATTIWGCFVILVGAKNINYRQIVKYHFIIETILLSLNFLADSIGYVDKSELFTGDTREGMFGDIVRRFEFGYPAAIDFATHVFYILLDYWILRKGRLRWFELFVYATSIFVVITFCDARQPAACIMLIIICSWYVKKRLGKNKSMGPILGYCLILCMPVFAIISIYASAAYNESDFNWFAANLIVSGRLGYGYEAIRQYGFHWLANDIEMLGGGHIGIYEYSYVDCSYLHYLLRWGALLFVTYMIGFLRIGINAWRRKDSVLLFCMLLAGLSSVMTQYLFLYNYCILLLALTASHKENVGVKKMIILSSKKKELVKE